ncbi:MAG: putative quinol monooxygenase [Albidovulum sp.]|nr:putative quinol monooxygenase [Albidovulum sp.]
MANGDSGGAFVVLAEFEVKDGKIEEFLALARDDSKHSVQDEPGCRQFDVLLSPDEPNVVAFYEVYDTREDFDAHLTTPHFDRFASRHLELIVAQRPARFFTLSFP